MRKDLRYSRPAFTLIELLVVVAIIALLISILLPSLQRARQQANSAVCLSNLRTMGQAVVAYTAEAKDGLPGPLHPAIYRGAYNYATEYQRNRFLLWFLRRQLTDSSGEMGDDLSTCPVSEYMNPDENFERVPNPVHPTHYVINTVGAYDEQGGAVGGVRITDPPYYFGWSHWSETGHSEPPQKLSKIKRPAEEWMIADAWYRMRPNAIGGEFQQEGPYQWDWSGQAFPNFAPHFSGMVYDFVSLEERRSSGSRIRDGKEDGETNTVFFDGHAEPVPSKTYYVGDWDLLYGFEGTVNPAMEDPPEGDPAWDGIWR
ncbi:MAG: type II secretion system protein [Phycisphaerae bacterium]